MDHWAAEGRLGHAGAGLSLLLLSLAEDEEPDRDGHDDHQRVDCITVTPFEH